MPHVIENLIEQGSTSTGATTVALSIDAKAPYRSFGTVMADGDTTQAMVVNHDKPSEWQAALYRYSGGALNFVDLIESSTGSPVDFSAGVKRVSITPLAQIGGQSYVAPARVATTANITLSGLQTLDGITQAAFDRTLVKHQTDPVENGLWLAAEGAWVRADERGFVQGTAVLVTEGRTQGGTTFELTTPDPLPGAGPLAFQPTIGSYVRRADNPAYGIDCTGATGVDEAALARFGALGGYLTFPPDAQILIAAKGDGAGGVTIEVSRDTYFVWGNTRLFTNRDADGKGLDATMVIVKVPSAGPPGGVPIDVTWQGAYIDQQNQRISTSTPMRKPGQFPKPSGLVGTVAATTGVSFRGKWMDGATAKAGFRNLIVRGVRGYSGAHWTTAGGDQGIHFAPGFLFGLFEDFQWTGNPDLCGYFRLDEFSGQASMHIRHGHMFSCFGGVSIKGSPTFSSMEDLWADNCIVAYAFAKLTGSGARGCSATRIHTTRCEISMRFVESDEVKVTNSSWLDAGASDAAGVAIRRPDLVTRDGPSARYGIYGKRPSGVSHSGASRCKTLGITMSGTSAAYLALADASYLPWLHSFNRVEDDTDDGTTYTVCDRNEISGCYYDGIYSPGSDDDTKNTNTIYDLNQAGPNVTISKVVGLSATSVERIRDASTGRIIDSDGVIRPISPKSANYSVARGDHTLLFDTTSGGLTATLPSSPAVGTEYTIGKRSGDGNTLTIARNTRLINGTAANYSITAAYGIVTLRYLSSGTGWFIVSKSF